MSWSETRGTDPELVSAYNTYQARYAGDARQSDLVLIQLLAGLLADGRPLRVLDIGCSTGNFLRHLRAAVPELALVGGDVVASVVEDCRADPTLAGIDFEVMDILDLQGEYDVVVANAVLPLLDDDEFERAIASTARVLRPRGALLAFDWFHPFEQDLEIVERSARNPDGLRIRFRPYARVRETLELRGFTSVTFEPFDIPIDLELSDRRDDLTSYTETTAAGRRLCFRGTLFQPWCHLLATRD